MSFVLVLSSTIVLHAQGRIDQINYRSLLDLVANDTLNRSNTTAHFYKINLNKSLISKSLGDSMEIQALQYNGKTVIAEASIDGKIVGILSNYKDRQDYFSDQIFSFKEEKELFKSIVLAASKLAVENYSLSTISAKALISFFKNVDSTSEKQLRLLPVGGFSTNLSLEKLVINDYFGTTVYRIKDWNNSALWENVFIVDPNTVIDEPSTLNIDRPSTQSKAYALLQILLWPEFFGIILNEEILEPELVPLELQDKSKINDHEIFNFSVVESKPIFPGCENLATENEKFMCFIKNIKQYIAENYEFPELARQMGIQGKVYINFVIEKNGKVSNVTIARGVDKLIDDEAIRIIKLLPKFIPAMQRGKPVRMEYTVPINARLQ